MPTQDSLFIGRNAELQQFRQVLEDKLRQRGEPDIFIIQGNGGMGKTTLARHFVDIATNEKPFKDKFQTLWIDWEDADRKFPALRRGREVDPVGLFQVIRAAASRNKWGKQFKLYQKTVKDQAEADRQVMSAIMARSAEASGEFGLLQAATADVIAGVVRSRVPLPRQSQELVEALAHAGIQITLEQGQRLRGMIENVIRARLKPTLVEHFLNPHEQQAMAIARGLERVAAKKPLIVVFDSYEIVDRVDIWVRDIIRTAGSNIIWVMAGRHDLLRSRRFGEGYFKGYDEDFVQGLHGFELARLSADEINTYFDHVAPDRQLSKPDQKAILNVTGGIPLAVREAADVWRSGASIDVLVGDKSGATSAGQIVQGMTDTYLRHVVADGDRHLLYALALARGDVPVLRAMLADDPEAAFDLDDLLQNLARQYKSVHAHEARLQDEPERFIRNHLKSEVRRSSPEVERLNRRAVEVLEARLTQWEVQMASLEERCADPDWVNTVLDIAAHRFWLSSSEGWQWLMPRFLEAWAYSDVLLEGLLQIGMEWRDYWKIGEQQFLQRMLAVTSADPSAILPLLEALDKIESFGWLIGDGEAERKAILHLRWGQYHRTVGELDAAQVRLADATALLPKEGMRLRKELAQEVEALALLEDEARAPTVTSETDTMLARLSELTPERHLGWYQLGMQRQAVGELTGAVEAFRAAIKRNPLHVESHVGLGESLLERGNAAEAIDAFQVALELAPNHAAARVGIGRSYETQQDFNAAQANYARVDSAESQLRLANLQSQQGNIASAFASYQAALAKQPNNPDIHLGLGQLHRRCDEPTRAIEAYQQAVRCAPDALAPQLGLGELYQSVGLHDSAREAYQTAVALTTDQSTRCHIETQLGETCARQGLFTEAIGHYERALTEANDAPTELVTPHLGLARVQKQIGNFEEARVLYEEAYMLDEADFPHAELGHIYCELGDYEAATEAFQRAATSDRDEALLGLAKIDLASGQRFRTWAKMQQFLRRNTRHVEGLQLAGDALLGIGRYFAASIKFETALGAIAPSDPRRPQLLASLGEANRLATLRSDARKAYQQALALDDSCAAAHYGMGELHREADDFDMARTCYEMATSHAPRFASAHSGLGKVAFTQGDLHTAKRSFQRALTTTRIGTHDPIVVQSFIGLADVHHAAREFAAARDAYEQAREHGANGNLPYHRLVEVYARLGEAEKAIETFRRSPTAPPSNDAVATYLAVGDAHLQTSGYLNAINAYQRVLELDKHNHAALLGMGQAYLWEGEQTADQAHFESAESTFTQLLEQLDDVTSRDATVDPYTAATYCGLARAEQLLGKRDAAVGNYSFALEIDPDLPAAYRGLAEIHVSDENYEVAIPAFEKSLALEPQAPQTLTQLGDAWRALGAHTKSIDAYERAIALDQQLVLPYVGLGHSRLALGDAETALAAFQAALVSENWSEEAHGGISAEIQLGIADCHAQLGDIAAAQTAYEQAIELGYDKPFPYTRMGQTYLVTERYAEAADAFEKAAAQDEMDAAALHGQGRAYFALGRKNDALVAYEEAIAYDDRDAISRQQLAEVYAARNDVDDAIESYERAVELEPKQLAAWLGLAQVHYRERQNVPARRAFEHAIALDPTNADAQQALGELYLKAGEIEAAQVALRIASGQRPDSYDIQRVWAQTLSSTEQWEDAITAYRRALHLNGEDTQAWIGLGQAHLRLGEPQKALDALDTARRQYKGTAFPYLLLAETYQQLGRNVEATEIYEHVLTVEPSARAWLGIAETMVAQGQKDGAREYFERVIAQDRTCAAAYCGLAELDAEAKDFAAARANFEQAIALGERSAATYTGLGDAAFALGEMTVALDAYQESAEFTPDNPHVQHQIGQVYLAQEKWTAAQHAFEETLSLEPDHAGAQFGLARSLWRQDKLAEARPAFERSAELNPNHLATMVGLGRTYLSAGEWLKAKAAFEHALSMPPTDAHMIALAKAGLGDIAHEQERFESALNWYREARRLDDAAPVDVRKLGDALFHTGKIDEAQRQYAAAIKRNNRDVQANIGIGKTYVLQGEDEKAETAFQWAIGIDDKQAAPYLPLGKLLAQRGDLTRARDTLELAAELEPENPDVFVTYGDVAARLGSAEDALASYDLALRRDGRRIAAHMGKGDVMMSLGQYLDAQMAFGHVTNIDDTNVRGWRGLGAARLASGDLAGSETAYRMAARHDSADLDALLGLADARMQQRHYSEAISTLTQAVELAPDHLTAHLALGAAYVANLEAENGLPAFERAIELDDESADAHCGFGMAMLAMQQTTEAQAAFERALALDDELLDAHCGMGDVTLSLHSGDAAAVHFQRALALDADYAPALRGIGDMHLKAGEPEIALDHYQAALERDERLYGALKGAGFASLMLHAVEEAVAFFEPAVQRKQDDLELVVALGEAYEALRDGKRALSMYELADLLQPRDPVLMTLLGNAYRLLQQWHQAEDRYRVAIERDDQLIAARIGLGQVYLELERFFEGKFEFDRALRLDPESAEVHAGLGDFERRMYRQPDAIQHYHRALQLNPYYAPAYAGLATSQLLLGEAEDAATHFQRAIECNPYLASAFAGLGDAMKQLKRFDDAAAAYRQALELTPTDYFSLVSLIGVLRRLNQTAGLDDYIAEARRLGVKQTAYNLACFESICGNPDEALRQLRQALQMNLTNWEQISADPDLDFVRDQPEYARLAQRYGGSS